MAFDKKAYDKAYREANKEKIRQYERLRHAKRREKNKERLKALYQANKEKWKERVRDRYRAKKEVVKEGVRAWRKANPEKYTELSRRMKAMRRKALVPLSTNERSTLLMIESTRRVLTEETGTQYQIDHILPIRHGGIHHPCNVRILDGNQNNSKRAKITEDAMMLIPTIYRIYKERCGEERAEEFKIQVSKEIGDEAFNKLMEKANEQ